MILLKECWRFLATFGLMIAGLLVSSFAEAATQDIGPVYLDSVSLILVSSGGHAPGDMEIKIHGGFTPSGVTCTDGNYVTTLASTDPTHTMLGMLTAVRIANIPIQLRITDDPSHTAFSGRCSIVWGYF